jgi:hypothetical protein
MIDSSPKVWPRERLALEVNFTKVKEVTLDIAVCDVFYLLDTCYGTSAAIGGRKELLAASSLELPAQYGLNTMTRYICEILEELGGLPITIAVLHGALLNKYHENHDLFPTPVHASLDPNVDYSITLFPAPFGRRRTAVQVPPAASSEDSNTRCALSINLDKLDIGRFQRWVGSRPGGVEIEVLSLHSSTSFVLVITVPLSVWHMIPAHSAISFLFIVFGLDMVVPTRNKA